ncbi:MAG: hypothetical protein LBE09_05865 [Christensenellaceae bacterium]|jgi:transposase-like protein|nr:hypothetical protein [Christensenellaceae bacterium]
MLCTKCKSTNYVKNGFRRKTQSYLCKDCGHQFIERKQSCDIEVLVSLYALGLSYRTVGILAGIDCSTVFRKVSAYMRQRNLENANELTISISKDELMNYIRERAKSVDLGQNVSKWVNELLFAHDISCIFNTTEGECI